MQTGRGIPTPKAFPSGGRCPSAHTGADEGAIWYPTFPCRKGTLYRPSPQRSFSIAPLGNPVAPSSVTSGDSSPPRGSLWVVLPYTKKAFQIRARRWAPKQPLYRNNAPQPPKRASGNERAIKPGVQGACPRPSFSPFLGRNGDPRRAGGAPGRCAPRHRKSPDHPKGT